MRSCRSLTLGEANSLHRDFAAAVLLLSCERTRWWVVTRGSCYQGHMSDAEAVLAANVSFYRAFGARDLEAMDAVWARDAEILCIHPGRNPLRTRDSVMKSWGEILGSAGVPQISVDNATVFVRGDMAFIVCDEVLHRAVLAATNVFVCEGGEWKMCHHHAAPIAQPTVARNRSPEFLN